MIKKTFTQLGLGMLLLLNGAIALAATVTINFTGVVTNQYGNLLPENNIPIGQTISGSVSYETQLPNTSPFSFMGVFTDYTSTSGIALNLANGTITSKLSALSLNGMQLTTIDNNGSWPDTFGMYQSFGSLLVQNFIGVYSIGVGFTYLDRIPDLDLPLTLDPADVTGSWNIAFDGTSSGVFGKITSFQVVSLVPEPNQSVLFLLGAFVTLIFFYGKNAKTKRF